MGIVKPFPELTGMGVAPLLGDFLVGSVVVVSGYENVALGEPDGLGGMSELPVALGM